MAAENLLIDNRSNGQTIKTVCEGLPELYVEPALALVIEAVDTVDGSTLVVPPEQEEVFWVFDLVGEQQADGLQRLLPSVYVIPQEQIVGLWREASILE